MVSTGSVMLIPAVESPMGSPLKYQVSVGVGNPVFAQENVRSLSLPTTTSRLFIGEVKIVARSVKQ